MRVNANRATGISLKEFARSPQADPFVPVLHLRVAGRRTADGGAVRPAGHGEVVPPRVEKTPGGYRVDVSLEDWAEVAVIE